MTVAANFAYRSEAGMKSGQLTLQDYEVAESHDMRVSAMINARYSDADQRFGSAFQQGAESLGIYVKGKSEYGILPTTIKDCLNGVCMQKAGALGLTAGTSPSGGGIIVSPGTPVGSSTPASRVFFPEVILAMMDDRLYANYGREMSIFQGMLASDEAIGSEVFTQPLINRSAPDGQRSQPIAQNALPRNLVSISTSQTSKAITTHSVGLQISEQAQGHATIDLVGIILAQQADGERILRLWEDIGNIANGNTDAGQAAMSAVASTTYDASFTGGTVTQTGWLKMLWDPTRKLENDSIICTIDDVLAIQGRTGRPLAFDPKTTGVNLGNLGDAGLNIEPVLTNIESYIPNILIIPDGILTAQHMLVFDSRYFLRRVRNVSATFSATEKMVLQRSDVFRFDFGEITYRLLEEAGKLVDYS